MTNRIDNILARQKKHIAVDTVMFTIMAVLAALGFLALNFSA